GYARGCTPSAGRGGRCPPPSPRGRTGRPGSSRLRAPSTTRIPAPPRTGRIPPPAAPGGCRPARTRRGSRREGRRYGVAVEVEVTGGCRADGLGRDAPDQRGITEQVVEAQIEQLDFQEGLRDPRIGLQPHGQRPDQIVLRVPELATPHRLALQPADLADDPLARPLDVPRAA